MIQEIKIKNFLSFKEEVVLSFEATKDTTFEGSHVVEVAPGVRLLRFMMVMGANASGKSNLLWAVEFLRNFWFSQKREEDESTGVQPFMLDTEAPMQCSEFEMRFWVNGVKYWYVLKLDSEKVHEERFYYYKSVQPTMLMKRELNSEGNSIVTINTNAVKVSSVAVEEIQLKCLRNMSFFAARKQVNISLGILDDAREWMRGGILPLIAPDTPMFEYAKKRLHEDTPLRNYLLDFVNRADFNITDVQSNETHNKWVTQFEHTVTNDRGVERYLMPDSLQSFGTKRTLGLEAAIYEAVKNNSVLVLDEFESSRHPDLLEFEIQRFLQERSQSQMLITTHYDPLLATVDDLIRKDNVWFTEKAADGSTSLYSLAEFKGLGKMSSASIRNAYRHGQFGALPNI